MRRTTEDYVVEGLLIFACVIGGIGFIGLAFLYSFGGL